MFGTLFKRGNRLLPTASSRKRCELGKDNGIQQKNIVGFLATKKMKKILIVTFCTEYYKKGDNILR